MDRVSFTSTYQIPMKCVNKGTTQKWINYITNNYPNHKISNNSAGALKVSMPEGQDRQFEAVMKQIGGFKRFLKLPVHDVAPVDLEKAISKCINNGDFLKKG